MKRSLQIIHQLDKESWLLILTGILFTIATTLSNTFVNIYIWKIEENLIILSWFHFAQYLSSLLASLFAAWLMKKIDRAINIRIGVGILSIFYLMVLLLGSSATDYVWILGFLLGIGNGFYWITSAIMYFEITNQQNRDHFNGVNGLGIALAGMISPLISGYVISHIDHHFGGYRIIFAVSLMIFLSAVIVSFFFHSRIEKEKLHLLLVLSQSIRPDRKWFWVCFSMLLQGLREGVLIFLVGLLVYKVTHSEMKLGWFLTLSSLASLLASYILSKIMNLKRRMISMWISVIMLGIVSIPFVILQNNWTIFLLGLGIALFYPFFYFPLTSTIFDAIGESPEKVKLRSAYTTVKEMLLNVGRMLSIILFIGLISFSDHLSNIRWYILVIAFIQIPICYFIHKMKACNI